jgi:DNA-binding MarR family transcriptional regulator
MTHPSGLLDDVIHQRVRLGIMAVLAEADEAEFTFLKEQLDLTDGNLNRHLQVLEEASYIARRRNRLGGRTKTWIRATKSGRAALANHLATLQLLIDQTKGAP